MSNGCLVYKKKKKHASFFLFNHKMLKYDAMELFIFHTYMGFYSQTRLRIEPNVLRIWYQSTFGCNLQIRDSNNTPIFIPHLKNIH